MKLRSADKTQMVLVTPEGKEIPVARTPGTAALLKSYADGGVIEQTPEIQALLGETQPYDTSLPQFRPMVSPPAGPGAAAPPPPAPTGGTLSNTNALPIGSPTSSMADIGVGAALRGPQPLPKPGAGGGMGMFQNPYMGAYNAALRTGAQHEAESYALQGDVLRQQREAIEKAGPAPVQQPVNRGAFYSNLGSALGAKTPAGQRLLGGIATGLVAGVGQLGAALSHTQNYAGQIIQDAIQQAIAQQEGANAMSRQQWVDQVQYATTLANQKIAEIAAHTGEQRVKDQADILIANNKMQSWMGLMQRGMLKPELAQQILPVVQAQKALADYQATLGRLAGHGWAGRMGMRAEQFGMDKLGMEGNPDIRAAETQRSLAVSSLAQALRLGHGQSIGEKEILERVDKTLPRFGDADEVRSANFGALWKQLDEIEQGQAYTARGFDPTASKLQTFEPEGGE